MALELNKQLLKKDIEGGNVGMVFEHLADVHTSLSDKELLAALSEALKNRALQKDGEAFLVDQSWQEEGKGEFEKARATNLRDLAERISKLL